MSKRSRRMSSKASLKQTVTAAEVSSPVNVSIDEQKLAETTSAIAVPKRPRWKKLFESLRDKIVVTFLYLLFGWPVILLLSPIIFIPCYRASRDSVEFTVDRRERVISGSGDSLNSYYLVWSREGDVYCVSDSWSFLSFDSSDRYGLLKEGSAVKAEVAGWRIPFLSWYRNIIKVDSVSSEASELTRDQVVP